MKQDIEKLYEEYQVVLDKKLLPLGFEKDQERADRGELRYITYSRDYFIIHISISPKGFLFPGRVKIEGTGELDLNLLKTKKEEIVEALDNWITMLDVWLAQNK